MEYQKIINLLDDTTNQPSKSRTRNQVEVNDESKERCDNSNIRIITSMTRLNLFDYSDAQILVKGNITVPHTASTGAAVNNTIKKLISKNFASFTNCITEINNTQVNHAQNIDVVIEHSDAYLKTSGSLLQYLSDEPAPNANGENVDFPANNNNSASFKFKEQITGKQWHKRR